MIIRENLPEDILVKFPQYTRNIGFYRFTPYQVLVDLMLAESIRLNSIVMDAGCGRNSVLPTNIQGIAVDILYENLSSLKQNRDDLEYVCANLEALPFKPTSFSIIICRDVLEHCDSALTIKEIGRVLRHRGVFIASTSNGYSLPMILDQLFGTISDRLAIMAGSKYYRRTQHLNPYSFKLKLAQAGLGITRLLMVTTPPFLTAQTWREFVEHMPWKLVPWLFISIMLGRFRIFRETLVVKATKSIY